MEIKGLLYFPVDIHFLESDTMLLLANDYGLEATSIVMHLLSRIYANGYYIQWDERRCKVFASSLPTKVSPKKIMRIVEILLADGFLDKTQYETNHILTSQEIQNSYVIVTKKRKKMPPIDPKFIVNSELLPKKCELTEFNGIGNKSQNDSQPIDKQESKQNLTLENESTTEKKETNSGQIKEKKIKGKERKENSLKIQVKGEGEKFENLEFDRWRKELLDDEDWCATLVRFSGKGLAVLDCAHEAMEIFRDYLILRDQIEQNNTRKEFQYNFIAWWRFNNFTTNMDELRRGKKGVVLRPAWNEEKRKQSKIENLNQVFNDAEFIAKKMFCNHE